MKRSGQVGLVLLTALGLASCSRPQPRPIAVEQQPLSPPAVVSPALSTPESEATMVWDKKPRDPCLPEYFDKDVCQTAINTHGYHYGGMWIPLIYAHSFSHYYSGHQTYLSSGGAYHATPVEVYRAGFKAPAAGTVVRGGFGSTATAIHASTSSSHSSSSSPSSSHSSSSSTSTHSSSSSSSHSSGSSSAS